MSLLNKAVMSQFVLSHYHEEISYLLGFSEMYAKSRNLRKGYVPPQIKKRILKNKAIGIVRHDQTLDGRRGIVLGIDDRVVTA